MYSNTQRNFTTDELFIVTRRNVTSKRTIYSNTQNCYIKRTIYSNTWRNVTVKELFIPSPQRYS